MFSELRRHLNTNSLISVCREPFCFEIIRQKLFTDFGLTMNFERYVLIGSTVRSYLAWLKDGGKLDVMFEDSLLLWKAV